jgi:hypothetical protein
LPVLKGAFLKLDAGLLGGLPNIILFQFNPETVSRTPSIPVPPQAPDGSGARDSQSQPGEPTEQISFSLRLDATDRLAEGDPIAAASGILPALSALELLLYPGSPPALDLSLGGVGGSQPYQMPPLKLGIVLFFWGPLRILPVAVTSLSIQETEYDQLLNPIRAEVGVTLSVLTPAMLAASRKLEIGVYRYTQKAKEVMAALNLASPPDLLTKTLTAL